MKPLNVLGWLWKDRDRAGDMHKFANLRLDWLLGLSNWVRLALDYLSLAE